MFNFPYIHRELEAPILRGTLRNRAELILVSRQVGKSTMLDHLVQNQRFIKLTGEDEDDLSILADPKTFLTLTQQFPNVIIDEAQFVPNIGRVIKRLVDNNTTDSRIFVTGSSALTLVAISKNLQPAASIRTTFGLFLWKNLPNTAAGSKSSAKSMIA